MAPSRKQKQHAKAFGFGSGHRAAPGPRAENAVGVNEAMDLDGEAAANDREHDQENSPAPVAKRGGNEASPATPARENGGPSNAASENGNAQNLKHARIFTYHFIVHREHNMTATMGSRDAHTIGGLLGITLNPSDCHVSSNHLYKKVRYGFIRSSNFFPDIPLLLAEFGGICVVLGTTTREVETDFKNFSAKHPLLRCGLAHASFDGSTATLEQCQDGNLDVLFCTGPLLGRGFNCEHFTSVILSSHPPSPRELVQRLGRVSRRGQLGAALIVFNPDSPSNGQHQLEKVYFDNDGDEDQMRKWDGVRSSIARIKQIGLWEGACLRKSLYLILYEMERDSCSAAEGEVFCGFCREREIAEGIDAAAKLAFDERNSGKKGKKKVFVGKKPVYKESCVLAQLNQLVRMLKTLAENGFGFSTEDFFTMIVKREALDAAKQISPQHAFSFKDLKAFDKDKWLGLNVKVVNGLEKYATNARKLSIETCNALNLIENHEWTPGLITN
ncbi:hypothetical protein HDU98_003469, partial [Podochytrium sp. JEL0797]